MTMSDELLNWSTRWRLSAGVITCKSCQVRQEELDQALNFVHSPGCMNCRFGTTPWVELAGLVPSKSAGSISFK